MSLLLKLLLKLSLYSLQPKVYLIATGSWHRALVKRYIDVDCSTVFIQKHCSQQGGKRSGQLGNLWDVKGMNSFAIVYSKCKKCNIPYRIYNIYFLEQYTLLKLMCETDHKLMCETDHRILLKCRFWLCGVRGAEILHC